MDTVSDVGQHPTQLGGFGDGASGLALQAGRERQIMNVGITFGTRFPAFATAMGPVLLAGLDPAALDDYFTHADLTPPAAATVHDEPGLRVVLDRVRRQGWVLNDQELGPGLRSVVAPVLNRLGVVVAAVNVSTTTEGRAEQVCERLRATAREISAELVHIAV